MEQLKKINLGCGSQKKEGFVNVDWNRNNNPEVVHDLNVIPYPFEDSSCDYMFMSHVLEHLDKPFDVMAELHRILKPGATVLIKVPHFSRGFTHAEHRHGFDVTFPMYFNRTSDVVSGFYGVEFNLKKLTLSWLAFFHLMPLLGYGKISIAVARFASRIVSFFANLSPALCSRIWCFWVGGFDEIEFEFECKKDKTSFSNSK